MACLFLHSLEAKARGICRYLPCRSQKKRLCGSGPVNYFCNSLQHAPLRAPPTMMLCTSRLAPLRTMRNTLLPAFSPLLPGRRKEWGGGLWITQDMAVLFHTNIPISLTLLIRGAFLLDIHIPAVPTPPPAATTCATCPAAYRWRGIYLPTARPVAEKFHFPTHSPCVRLSTYSLDIHSTVGHEH